MADINDQLANVDAKIREVDAQLHTNRNVDMPTMKQKIDDVISRLLPNTYEQIEKLEKQQSGEVLTMKNRADALLSKATELGKLLAILQLWIEEKNAIEHRIREAIEPEVKRISTKFDEPMMLPDAIDDVQQIQALLIMIDEETDQINKAQQLADQIICRIEPLDDLKKRVEHSKSQLKVSDYCQ